VATTARRWGVAVLAGLAVWGLGSQAVAQQNLFTRGNPSLYQLALNQRAGNQLAMGAAQLNPFTGIPTPSAPAVYNPFTGLPGSPGTIGSVALPGSAVGTPLGTPVFNPGFPGGTLSNVYTPSLATGYDPYGSSGSSPYGYGWWNPWGNGSQGDTLRGVSAVIEANGKYMSQVQDARLKFEDWQKARLETRRRIIDEWMYERANLPTWQDEQERLQRANLRRALSGPALTEVLSGDTLKTLYDDIRKRTASGQEGGPVTIDENALKQINWSTSSGGNVAALKPLREPNGSLRWPNPLISDAFKDDTRRIDKLAHEAVQLALQQGKVDPATIKELRNAVNDLNVKISGPNADLSASQWIEARRFLNQLSSAITALEQPDVGDQISGKVAVQARTVRDLVQELNKRGLTFAPAVSGDETAYVALYNALAAYAQSMQPGGRGNQ
jgi:hypothetical protein